MIAEFDPPDNHRARYERFAAFLAAAGLIDKPPPLATYAVELP